MKPSGQALVAVLVALCVLGAFISPLVPTPLTTLRSHHSLTSVYGMALAGAIGAPAQAAVSSYMPRRHVEWRPSGTELIVRTCVRLC